MRLTAPRLIDLAETERDQRRRQLAELRQQRDLEQARRNGLREIPIDEIDRIRFGHLEHDGTRYRILRGIDPVNQAAAYFRDGGQVVWLERAP